METTAHHLQVAPVPVEHDAYGGDVVPTGSGEAFLRFRWTGPLPGPVRLRYFDGCWRSVPLWPVQRLPEGWLLRGRIRPARPAVRYHLELPGQGLPVPPAPPSGAWSVDLHALRAFSVPRWVAGSVMYQIFPDRFFNGRPDNDPPGTVPWDSVPTLTSFFGGDLEGIRRRLDYLADLGVGAIYLNPIVQAPSPHRYDASDYLQVDPALGSQEDFRRLAQELHRRGMRLILDAVFNHTGETFWAFQDVVRRGPQSPYYHWYFIHRWPIVRQPPSYACWWGLPHLPKLNTSHPEVREYLFQVTRHWMELGADGWRLDVPNEVEGDFWQVWRALVKRLNPQAYIVGEIWHDAAAWLGGDQFDAVMNYVLRDALLDFFVRRTTTGARLAEVLHAQAARYPAPAVFALMNLLGSHDTERILTVAGQQEGLVRGMFAWLFTWPGIPCVYYGDEVGMTGGKDPDCRRTFPWDESRQRVRLWRWVRRLAALRRNVPALAWGEPVVVEVDGSDEVAAFGRGAPAPGHAPVVVAVSRSERPQRVRLRPAPGLVEHAGAEADRTWVDLLTGRRAAAGLGRQEGWEAAGGLELELPPWGVAVLAWERPWGEWARTALAGA